MNKFSAGLTLANQNIEVGKSLGVIQLSIEDERLRGRTFTAQGIEMVNFGSCSYTGLEMESRLKNAAIEAIKNYGTQYSSSRSYVSLGLYEKLEAIFEKIFGKPVILATSTSMGHFSAIPVLVSKDDAVILDQQVHSSVRTGVKLIQADGTHVEKIPHSDMSRLEKRIVELSKDHDVVWYMADGIYSMYGDVAPIDELVKLLDKYPKLYLYMDDAHGVGWYGKNGRGYVLEKMDFHPRMVLTASCAKAFGACGGLLVFPNEKIKTMVRNTGGTLMFSGPMQPATLASLLASAELHMSNEIVPLQKEVSDNIDHFIETAQGLGLPVANLDHTPVFYIGAGTPLTGSILTRKLMDKGFYTNIAGFPAVPFENAGIRITITRHQTKADITNLLNTIVTDLRETCKENDYPLEKIFNAFGLPMPKRKVA